MECTSSPNRSRAGRVRGPLRVLVIGVFLVGLAELTAWAGIALLGGEPPAEAGATGVSATDEAEAPSAGPDADEADALGAARLDALDRMEHRIGHAGLHPYLGFMPYADTAHPTDEMVLIQRPEFYAPDSPIFSEDPADLVVAVTGGSVSGQFMRFGGGRVLAKLLENHRRFAGRRVRLVGMGFAGMKQPQQLMALQYVLSLGGRIDVLIALDGFNEVALHELDNHKHGVAMVYPRLWYFRAEEFEGQDLRDELERIGAERLQARQRLEQSPLRFSRMRRLAWCLEHASSEKREQAALQALRDYRPSDELDLTVSGPPHNPPKLLDRLEEQAAIWGRSTRQMAATARANGFEFFAFLQPNQHVPGSKPLSEQEQRECYKPNQGYGAHVELSYPLLQAEGARLAAEGIRFFDLTGVFAEHEETIYVDSCCHVNKLGNRLMGQAIALAVTRRR